MKHIFLKTFLLIGSISVLFGGSYFYNTTDFPLHLEQEYNKRQINKQLPQAKTIEILSLGHSKSYADFLWLSMIQYVGNNLSKGNFANHSIHLLERVTDLSPQFSQAYEWTLWMLPIPQSTNLEYSDEQKKAGELPLEIAMRGIKNTCNQEKIDYISAYPLSKLQNLLAENTYKNPCKSGMLPYLMAFYGGQLMNNPPLAEQFYKIASMHDDTPSASQVLAIIASQPKDNPKNISENFAIMALGGYDTEPYHCLEGSNTLLSILHKDSITPNDVKMISDIEKNLEKIPEGQALGIQTCEDFFERSVKYFYLTFITQESKKYPEITKIDDLLPKIGLEHIPTTRSQTGFTITQKGNHWEYSIK